MPYVQATRAVTMRMNTEPAISKRALVQEFAFEFPDSLGPDYGVLTMFTGPQPRSFSLQDMEVYQQKTVGDSSTLQYGFYVTMTANGQAQLESMRDFGAFGRSVVENEIGTLSWNFFRVRNTLTFHIMTFFATREAATIHLNGDLPKKFGAEVGALFAVEPVLENTNVLDAHY